ncbi:OLC1v1016629C1 [Oldenlandia corymbosa var. corymbosa]|uniref:RBR-type E3 ubiquitin transferase n=1 Tax=Oldenlandia corymbosa var. corymbosa TaxID=529605 RepID=A0AAV1E7K3_OLDCO|nr:OLC1v1016629C1 [Oldenlandia corymbosa var. corymbosa]
MATLVMEVVMLDNDHDDVASDDDEVSILHANPVLLEKGRNSSSAMNSTGTKHNNKRVILDEDDDDVDEVQVISSRTKRMLYLGECSNSKPETVTITDDDDDDDDNDTVDQKDDDDTFLCDFCVDKKPKIEKFSIKGCNHTYCSECLAKYVASKLKQNHTHNISCPSTRWCKGRLEPQDCGSILPAEVFDRWNNALSEAMLLASDQFYCPYKDCSAHLVDKRSSAAGNSIEAITDSKCPHCRRMFCASCGVPWHAGISCEEFGKLKKDGREMEGIKVMNVIAKDNELESCPGCGFFVERTQGCRCGLFFVCD